MGLCLCGGMKSQRRKGRDFNHLFVSVNFYKESFHLGFDGDEETIDDEGKVSIFIYLYVFHKGVIRCLRSNTHGNENRIQVHL